MRIQKSSRFGLAALALASVLYSVATLAPRPAAAVGFEVTELSGCDLASGGGDCIGQLVTIGLRIGADPGEEIYGIGASIFGYDEAVADFVDGQVVDSIFHAQATPGGDATGGLMNFVDPTLVESELGGSGPRVAFLDAFDLRPHSENENDPGLDGLVGGRDAQLRVRFRIVGSGRAIVSFGTGYAGDAVVYASGETGLANTVQVLLRSDGAPVVVPEPGPGVLLALGLAGLACVRDQRARRPAMDSAIAR